MITNVQLLRKELDDIRHRVARLEAHVSNNDTRPETTVLSINDKTDEPAEHSANVDNINISQPKGGLRRWTSGPGVMDGGTSKRWRDRQGL